MKQSTLDEIALGAKLHEERWPETLAAQAAYARKLQEEADDEERRRQEIYAIGRGYGDALKDAAPKAPVQSPPDPGAAIQLQPADPPASEEAKPEEPPSAPLAPPVEMTITTRRSAKVKQE